MSVAVRRLSTSSQHQFVHRDRARGQHDTPTESHFALEFDDMRANRHLGITDFADTIHNARKRTPQAPRAERTASVVQILHVARRDQRRWHTAWISKGHGSLNQYAILRDKFLTHIEIEERVVPRERERFAIAHVRGKDDARVLRIGQFEACESWRIETQRQTENERARAYEQKGTKQSPT